MAKMNKMMKFATKLKYWGIIVLKKGWEYILCISQMLGTKSSNFPKIKFKIKKNCGDIP